MRSHRSKAWQRLGHRCCRISLSCSFTLAARDQTTNRWQSSMRPRPTPFLAAQMWERGCRELGTMWTSHRIEKMPFLPGVRGIPEGSSGRAFNHCIPDPLHSSLKPQPHLPQLPWPRLFLLTSSSPDLEVPWTGVGVLGNQLQRGLFSSGTSGGWGWSLGARAGGGAPLWVPGTPRGPAELWGERPESSQGSGQPQSEGQ